MIYFVVISDLGLVCQCNSFYFESKEFSYNFDPLFLPVFPVYLQFFYVLLVKTMMKKINAMEKGAFYEHLLRSL